jgi:hypothetical protein
MIELKYVTFLHVATEAVSDLGVCLAKTRFISSWLR